MLTFDPRHAAVLRDRVVGLAGSARDFAMFGESEPDLVSECGVEIGCLECRTILAGGAPERVVRAMSEAAQLGRPAGVESGDIEAVSRLEAVLAQSSNRIGLRLASIDAAAAQEPLQRWGSLVALGTGVLGLVKSIF